MTDTKKIEDLQKDIETMEKELAEAKKTLRDMRTKGLREAMEALDKEFDWKDFEGERPPKKEFWIDKQGRKNAK